VDWTEPNVCVSENLTLSPAAELRIHPKSVPRWVVDVKAISADGDSKVYPTETLPGKLLIDQKVAWVNDGPTDADLLIRVTRGPKSWLTSNPNAIEFRDRWTYAVGRTPSVPITTGPSNGKTGGAIDNGTNTVAEPNPGRWWMWRDTHSSDEWISEPLAPGDQFQLWYQCYLWTPPKWSDNANKNNPQHAALAVFSRIQIRAHPQQGQLVQG